MNVRKAAVWARLAVWRRFHWLAFAAPPIVVLVLMTHAFETLLPGVNGDFFEEHWVPRAPVDGGMIALAAGRFEWMSFILAATVLFVGCIWFAVVVMRRHLDRPVFRTSILICAVLGLGAAIWPGPNVESFTQTVLFAGPRALALPMYGAEFRDIAIDTTKQVYALGIVATAFVIFAAAACLSRNRTAADSLIKQRDVKVLILLSAVLLAFIANFLGHWLSWPASFLDGQQEREVLAFADGVRLYFGVGYTLALAAFSAPAILALSRRLVALEGDVSAVTEHRLQKVFKSTEISALLSTMLPFVSTVVGSKLPFSLAGG